MVCFVGSAATLEPDIKLVYGGEGADCTAANGCGVHVHAGTDCVNTETQGMFHATFLIFLFGWNLFLIYLLFCFSADLYFDFDVDRYFLTTNNIKSLQGRSKIAILPRLELIS